MISHTYPTGSAQWYWIAINEAQLKGNQWLAETLLEIYRRNFGRTVQVIRVKK